MKKILWIFIVVVVLGISGYFGYNYWLKITAVKPQNFEECINLPDSVLNETTPIVCVSKSGVRFTQPLTPELPQNSNPTNTSIWKIYSGNGFTIKYPDSWQESSSSDGIKTFVSSDNYYNFSVEVSKNINESADNKPYKTVADYVGSQFENPQSIGLTEIDGKSLPILTVVNQSETTNKIIFFSENEKEINSINLAVKENRQEKLDEVRQLYFQILSTFKFTTTTSSTFETPPSQPVTPL